MARQSRQFLTLLPVNAMPWSVAALCRSLHIPSPSHLSAHIPLPHPYTWTQGSIHTLGPMQAYFNGHTHITHMCAPPPDTLEGISLPGEGAGATGLGSAKGTPWKTLQEEVAPVSSVVNRVQEGEPLVLWESPTSGTCSHRHGSQNKEEPLL